MKILYDNFSFAHEYLNKIIGSIRLILGTHHNLERIFKIKKINILLNSCAIKYYSIIGFLVTSYKSEYFKLSNIKQGEKLRISLI